MESRRLKPLGFVANDYGLACYGLGGDRPAVAVLPRHPGAGIHQWLERSYLLKNAFREVAVIGGLVERQHPASKTGRQVSFSTDLIYDVLRKYSPTTCCCALPGTMPAPALTELGRLVGWSTGRR
jgi:ATP-dependent Lhr-like helicase